MFFQNVVAQSSRLKVDKQVILWWTKPQSSDLFDGPQQLWGKLLVTFL
jgi:hypothetical protein